MKLFMVSGQLIRDFCIVIKAKDEDDASDIAGYLTSEQLLGDPGDYDRDNIDEVIVAPKNWIEWANVDTIYTRKDIER